MPKGHIPSHEVGARARVRLIKPTAMEVPLGLAAAQQQGRGATSNENVDFGPPDPRLAARLVREARKHGCVLREGSELFFAREHARFGNVLANEEYFQTALQHYWHAFVIAAENWAGKGKDVRLLPDVERLNLFKATLPVSSTTQFRSLHRHRSPPIENVDFGARDPRWVKQLLKEARENVGVLRKGSELVDARDHTRSGNVLANEEYFQIALQHYWHAFVITAEYWSGKGKDVGLFSDIGKVASILGNDYIPYMERAVVIKSAAELLSRIYPSQDVTEALDYLAAQRVARETTGRATAEQRVALKHAKATAKWQPPSVSLPGGLAWPTEQFEDSPEFKTQGGIVRHLERVWKPVIATGVINMALLRAFYPSTAGALDSLKARARRPRRKAASLPRDLEIPLVKAGSGRRRLRSEITPK